VKLSNLFALFEQARALTGHTEFVVIGSLSVLGVEDDRPVPGEMSMSIDIDCYTKADPGRVFDLKAALGEDSVFHAQNGFYLDPVSPALPSLPEGWEARMNVVERQGLKLWFLNPDDAAISKYARSEPRDLRWARAGMLAGLVSLPTVRARLKRTRFLDAEEEQRVRRQVEADSAWFETLRARSSKPSGIDDEQP
jgi:hypothetical protein